MKTEMYMCVIERVQSVSRFICAFHTQVKQSRTKKFRRTVSVFSLYANFLNMRENKMQIMCKFPSTTNHLAF